MPIAAPVYFLNDKIYMDIFCTLEIDEQQIFIINTLRLAVRF